MWFVVQRQILPKKGTLKLEGKKKEFVVELILFRRASALDVSGL